MSEHTSRDHIASIDSIASIASIDGLPPGPTRLPRPTTDRLLDGGDGPEPVRQLLAAAAAPAQPGELDGEQVARLAFTMSTRCRPLPDRTTAHHFPQRTRALSWIVAAKAIAALALTAGASGVAVAATATSFPDDPPDASTQQPTDPHPPTAPPTVLVDRAHDTAQQPDTEPAPPDLARRDRTESGQTPTRTAPAARPQPGRSEINPAPDSTPATRPPAAPGNPQHTTGPANGNKKTKTPPGQQQQKKGNNNANDTAGVNTDQPEDSDHVGDPRSDTTKQQQKAGQE